MTHIVTGEYTPRHHSAYEHTTAENTEDTWYRDTNGYIRS
jgi:hypothetical protein